MNQNVEKGGSLPPEPLLDHRGRPLRTLGAPAGNPRLAVFYPGLNYTVLAPLFFYLARLLEPAGWDVIAVDYRYNEDPEFAAAPDDEKDRWFAADSVAVGRWVAGRAAGYGRVAYLGKSLGTEMLLNQVRAGLVVPSADLVWLTPGSKAAEIFSLVPTLGHRSLVAYGTADKHFLRAQAGRPAGHPRVTLVEIANAGHNFEVAGDLRRSVTAIADVVEAVGSFLAMDHSVCYRKDLAPTTEGDQP